jgi:hypothetical protein
MLSVEEIQHWAGLGPAGLIVHAQPTQTRIIPIQQRQEYRRKLLPVPRRRWHNCLPEISRRPGRVRGAVVAACAWTPESSEDARLTLGFVLLFSYI